jgi:hypothetical protein
MVNLKTVLGVVPAGKVNVPLPVNTWHCNLPVFAGRDPPGVVVRPVVFAKTCLPVVPPVGRPVPAPPPMS